MRHQLGFILQFGVLVFLPMLVLWQLIFGIPLIWMPMGLLAGIVLYLFGYKLRESE
jgi:hypothetical protein